MKKNAAIKNFEWPLFLLMLTLIFIGWINIYAASYNPDYPGLTNFSSRAGKQFLWIIVGLTLLFTILIIDSKFFAFISYPLYGLSLVILISVFVFGKEINGAKSWIDLGFLRIQPAEFTKIAVALVLAKYMGRHEFNAKNFKQLVIIAILIMTPVSLVLLQNDTGSALVFFAFMLVLYREGMQPIFLILIASLIVLFFLVLVLPKTFVILGIFLIFLLIYGLSERNKKNIPIVLAVSATILLAWLGFFYFSYHAISGKWFLILLFSVISAIVVFSIIAAIRRLFHFFPLLIILLIFTGFIFVVDYSYHNILEPHQQKRISILLGLESDLKGAGYNVNQSKISIGSGGFAGKGFLQGTQTKYDFVPEQSTDFIFCTIGEEWGFVGSTFFITLFVLLLWRITVIAERQRSRFSRVYAYGILSILAFHFMLNIGMTIGIMPVIGIPLPFISYGGSSLWTFIILVALLLRFDMNRNEIIR
ncbi:MAG: rod shape-determining protein RodA [Bacteroidales bacterium]|nr:rod shape-determining protein RodA [Bacteroidales bacterium]